MADRSDPRRSRPGFGGGVRRVPVRPRGTVMAGGGGFLGGGGSNMLRRRLSSSMVLVMSLCFIGFVTALYIFGSGKLYRSRTAAASA